MEKYKDDFSEKENKSIYEGPVLPVIVKLSLPILAGMFFQLIYNITDTAWISRIDINDPSYVGGTGIIFPIIFLAIALSNGILVGISSLVARGIGEQNRKIINSTTESGLIIAAVLAVFVISSGYLFDNQLVNILGASGSYKLHALEYLRYIIPAAALMFILSVFNGILQGEGLMKYVMISMMIGTAANIILDPVMIFIMDLGVKGAALATVISQVFSVFYSVSVFTRNRTLVKVEWRIRNIDTAFMKNIILVGFPQSLGQILMAVSFLIFNRVVVGIDPLALTAFSLTGRFDQAVLIPIFAIGAAIITLIGQNAGRGNFDRVREIWKYSLITAVLVVIASATVMIIFAGDIYSFFSRNDKVVWYAVTQTRILEYSFIFAAAGILARSFFQAVGFPVPALIITLLRLIIIAVPAVLIYVYVFDLKMYGVWFGLLTGNSTAAVISLLWTSKTIKKLEEGKLVIKHG